MYIWNIPALWVGLSPSPKHFIFRSSGNEKLQAVAMYRCWKKQPEKFHYQPPTVYGLSNHLNMSAQEKYLNYVASTEDGNKFLTSVLVRMEDGWMLELKTWLKSSITSSPLLYLIASRQLWCIDHMSTIRSTPNVSKWNKPNLNL